MRPAHYNSLKLFFTLNPTGGYLQPKDSKGCSQSMEVQFRGGVSVRLSPSPAQSVKVELFFPAGGMLENVNKVGVFAVLKVMAAPTTDSCKGIFLA